MPATASNEARETILIVDDEESILSVISEYFRRKGYLTVTAKNGREALNVLNRQRVDCCFTDIQMPQMNGLELTEEIHRRDNTLPVIVMTGFPSLESAIKTIQNGVGDFLIKPVNLKHMEICLRRVLQQRDLFAENILLKKEIAGKDRLEKVNRELVYKVDELHTLNNILTTFATIASTADIFRRAVETAVDTVHADQAVFFVINEAVREPFEVAAAGTEKHTASKGVPEGAGRPSPPAVASDAGAFRQLILEVAADQIPLLIADSREVRGLDAAVQSFMAVPLKIRQKVFGVLTAGSLQLDHLFSEKDLYYLSFLTQAAANAIENLALYENIYENLFATLYGFVNALEARDLYTRQHSNRVTQISMALGREMGCSGEELDTLNFAGHLHDIGKIGIRDDILLKPGRLSTTEFEKIKEHPAIGANIVARMGLWEKERQIILSHHERFDGRGYPEGLKADEIPFLARILAVADVYDAMASDRAYRQRMNPSVIFEFIANGAGRHFDPAVVSAFLRVYRDGRH